MLTLIKYLIIFDILQLLQLGQKVLALMYKVLSLMLLFLSDFSSSQLPSRKLGYKR